MKKMMILGAGVYQVPLIRTAKRMGFETIAVSIPGQYPGFAVADRVLEIDTRDKERVFEAAKREQITGICTTGTDVAVSSIGYVCDRMGLPGIPMEAAKVLCNKALMKQAFLAGGVRCAEGEKAYNLNEAVRIAEGIGYPVVVKRVDSSGSRGVTVVRRAEDMRNAWLYAKEKTTQDYVLVERMLRGVEIGVDGFIRDHKVVFLAPHTKFIYQGPSSTVPVGHAFPCPMSKALEEDIREQMQRAADASGADNCCFNADVFVEGDRCWVIELGGRCGATCIPELIGVSYGFDYYEAMLKEASGERAEFPEGAGDVPCMAKLMTSPAEGVITGIDEERLEDMRRRSIHVSIDHPVGGHVYAMTDGTDRIGQVLVRTDDAAVLDAAMAEARSCLMIDGRNLEDLWRS